MFDRNPFEDLDFRLRHNPSQRLLLIEVIALGAFFLLWWLLPSIIMFCLLLPTLAILVWATSFGWKQALSRLIEFLQTIHDRSPGGF